MTGPDATPTGGLGARLRRGAFLSSASLLVVQAVSLGQTLVLARILGPVEVGLFAAGTALAMFLLAFAEGALTQALIQRDGADLDDAADTVFWATLAGGVIMCLGALAAAPLVGATFGDPTAGAICAAVAPTMVLHAFTNVPDALMQRRLDFRRRVIVDPLTVLAFAVVSVVGALVGLGVWSMVAGSYAQVLVWVVASWSLARWRPGRGRPSVALWRELARFGFPLLLSTFADRVRDVLELVVVGRFLGTAALGHYRYGRRIAVLPGTVVIQAGAFVLFPGFARIAGDPERLRRAFLRALTWMWVAAVPVGGILVALGEPLVVLLLGERWRGAGVLLTAMAGLGLGQALAAVTTEAVKGTGRSRRLNAMTVVGLVSGVGLLLWLAPTGLTGVGLACSGAALVVGAAGLWIARDVVGVSVGELAVRLGPPLGAAAVATAGVAVLERAVVHADLLPTAAGLGVVALEAVGLVLGYLVVLGLVAPRTGRELCTALARLVPVR